MVEGRSRRCAAEITYHPAGDEQTIATFDCKPCSKNEIFIGKLAPAINEMKEVGDVCPRKLNAN